MKKDSKNTRILLYAFVVLVAIFIIDYISGQINTSVSDISVQEDARDAEYREILGE